jgi:hypothetical protein
MKTQCKTCGFIDDEEKKSYQYDHFYKVSGLFFKHEDNYHDDKTEVDLEACPKCHTLRVYNWSNRNNMEEVE